MQVSSLTRAERGSQYIKWFEKSILLAYHTFLIQQDPYEIDRYDILLYFNNSGMTLQGVQWYIRSNPNSLHDLLVVRL